MYSLLRPLLFALNPEKAHQVGLSGLETAYRLGLRPLLAHQPKPLKTKAFGIEFPNPVGLAAGLDKNAEHIDALGALGFGFLEVGTVTPRPQPGNPLPRMFRLAHSEAIINRMGFNNHGVDALVRNVEKASYKGVLGINIGKNKDTSSQNAATDYLFCLQRVYTLADYITVNISSPNTQGLRDLQQEDALRRLVMRLRDAQESLAARHAQRKPLLIKLAPDLVDEEIDSIAKVLTEAQIDGVIATNTTIDRSQVEGQRHATEEGGLSGRPLYGHSTYVLRRLRAHLPKEIPIIGVGGVMSGAEAAGKIAAGASLVQLYTGLIYRGPGLVAEAVNAIRRRREAPSSTG
ncbi:quinone-dependent dihydroorotate dehydrogenase [Pseudomarimonas arenosa]|uniref:Dihydroorotate dehydrogenase (quinone) n=1 Tax=Pseudomarimonas arenosa TaxID=2774145 RepID=A0AAW3ZIF3_9GAMM|nr:quinone-dependent dihydroorotate dehydrogenase [Pseudomarimonas arenosa]